MTTPNDAEVLNRLRALKVWRRDGERAPHKPLLLLLALGRAQRGDLRVARFVDLEKPLRTLLERFGPRRTNHPEYPFWRLQHDGLWEVTADRPMRSRQGNTDPPITVLRSNNAKGGFSAALDARLREQPTLIAEAARLVLDDHFPPSLHDDILDAVGLTVVTYPKPQQIVPRDPAFRTRILTAYEHRCAVCGYDALLDGMTVGLEAAHVKWHSHGGPSQVDNGLAVCSLHHKALDLGLFTVSTNQTVLVSSRVTGGASVASALLRHHGKPLIGPQSGHPGIHQYFQRWHAAQVFKKPARVHPL